jgi:hypothetical protein
LKGFQRLLGMVILVFLVAAVAQESFAGQKGDAKAGQKTSKQGRKRTIPSAPPVTGRVAGEMVQRPSPYL